MANSKNTVTTIPLASKLNMNRNQNQVCTTYDQMNAQNSPLYGGCLSPLHTKLQYTGNKSIIDKYGHRWYASGTNLYRTNENNSNATLMQAFAGDYVFSDTEVHVAANAGCIYNGSVYYSEITSTGTIAVKSIAIGGTASTSQFTVTPASGWLVRNTRMALINNNPTLVYVMEATTALNDPVRVGLRPLNGGVVETTVSLGVVVKNGRLTWSSNNNVASSNPNGSTSPNTYPIIISKPFNNWYGITVLNRHMNGENVTDNFGYCNFVYGYGYLRPIYLSCTPAQYGAWGNNYGQQRARLEGGKNVTVNEDSGESDAVGNGAEIKLYGSNEDQDWVTVRCPSAIFQENSLVVVACNYGLNDNRGYVKNSDNNVQNIYSMSYDIRPVDVNWKYANGATYTSSGGIGTVLNTANPPTAWSILYPTYQDRTGPYATHTAAGFAIDSDMDENQLGTMGSIDNTTLTTNQYHHRLIVSGSTKSQYWGYKSQKVYTVSTMLDSQDYSQARTMPGVLSTATLPTTEDAWKEAGQNRYVNKTAIYTTTGSSTQVDNWRLLFNYREGFLSGISFNRGRVDYEGTLVTAWDEVDDGFVVHTNGNQVLYKDISGVLHVVTAEAITETSLLNNIEVIDNRYLLIKCDSPQNVFDLVEERWGKFGSDWNNRIIQGFNALFHRDGIGADQRWVVNHLNKGVKQEHFFTTATYASGFNVAYQNTKSFSPSRLLPFVTANYVVLNQPLVAGNKRDVKDNLYGSVEKETLDYFASSGTASPKWKGSLSGTSTTGDSASLQGTSYPVASTGSLYNNMPVVNIKFINSYNGKFATQIGNKGYSMTYDGVRPVMLYNTTSIVDNIKEFFIVQSQTYAVVDSYICAISYSSSNVINGIEQLVDVNGMQFVGAFPSVAYFYSPASRSLYAFTGDADLQLFVQTDRISTVYTHLYAPNNEWIFLATNDGLYILTQQNVFRVPYSQLGISSSNTVSMFMTDDAWNVIQYQNGSNYNGLKVRLDKPDTTWSTVPVIVETEFFGQGDMKQEVCDTWYIRLYKGDEENNGTVTLSVKTLTDIVTKTDEKSMVINPGMWDDNDNTFIRYQPQYQMTQGSSLHIESAYPIAYLGVSHQMDNTSNSKFNI